jgi:hypothetical protein
MQIKSVTCLSSPTIVWKITCGKFSFFFMKQEELDKNHIIQTLHAKI